MPLVARQRNERARLVVGRCQPIDLGPERAVDLKVVGLMADDIDERFVPGEGEVLCGAVGP